MYALAFDTMWTVAQVLNYTEEMRLRNESKEDNEFKKCANLPGKMVPLNEFNYSNAFMGCIMKNNFYRINFTGVSVSPYGQYNTLYYAIIGCLVHVWVNCISMNSSRALYLFILARRAHWHIYAAVHAQKYCTLYSGASL